MAVYSGAKLRILSLAQLFFQETDEFHLLSMHAVQTALNARGIASERKTIYADIEALRAFGMDIVLQPGKYGGYYLAARPFELAELKLMVDAVQSSKFITEKKSAQLISKLESLTCKPQAAALQRQVHVGKRAKTVNEQVYYNVDALHAAISAGKQITFYYFNWALDFSSTPPIYKHYRRNHAHYFVRPVALTWENDNYYMIASSDETDMPRHYRVDKMENITLIETPTMKASENTAFFDTAQYTQKFFSMFSGREEAVTLLCRKDMVGILYDRFGAELMPVPYDETHFQATVSVAVSPQFYSWICGLSGGVSILAPETVRQGFRETLQHMLGEHAP